MRFVWLSVGLTALAAAAALYVQATRGFPPGPGPRVAYLIYPLACAFPLVGGLVIRSQPRNPIGWILWSFAACAVVQSITGIYAVYGLEEGWPAAEWAAWIADWCLTPAFLGIVFFLPLLFPTGRPPTPRWRPVLRLMVAASVFLVAAAALNTDEMDTWKIPNPAGLVPGWVNTVATALLIPFLALSITGLIVRYRGARGIERSQLRAVYALALMLLVSFAVAFVLYTLGLEWIDPVFGLIGVLYVCLPLAAGLAIARHGLYDIDLVVNRTLVFGALSAFVLLGYGGVVLIVGAIAGSAGNLASLLAAALVAMAAAPLRTRLQTAVNRMLYGDRDEPHVALIRLGARLEASLAPEDVLPAIVETVARSLRSPFAAVELREGDGFRREAAHGDEVAGTFVLPLVHGGETVGRLIVAAPAGGPIAPADRRLLDALAVQAGAAVHGVRLTRALQHSREELIAAREEERRRLRRDLHDGLGPQLAAIALQLGAARRLADRRDSVASLTTELEQQVRGAIDDIRRVVYDLRPPQLDEFGLPGALEQQAERFRAQFDVVVTTPAEIGPLPAAVEVAAYRIATEALANVARHSGATRCSIDLRRGDDLELEVADNGKGLPDDASHGVGLGSMRERAEELGGTCTVTSNGAGTRVCAHLPLPA